MGDSFATLLRLLREERSLTQEELAERAGITAKAVGALERGERRRPYPHTVRALADALDLDDGERARLVGAVPGRVRAEAPAHSDPGPSGPSGPPGPTTTSALPRTVDLVGRSADLENLVALLRDPGTRVVTLTGTGGVGKTTLAIEAARRTGPAFPGGVTLVELAGTADADGVIRPSPPHWECRKPDTGEPRPAWPPFSPDGGCFCCSTTSSSSWSPPLSSPSCRRTAPSWSS